MGRTEARWTRARRRASPGRNGEPHLVDGREPLEPVERLLPGLEHGGARRGHGDGDLVPQRPVGEDDKLVGGVACREGGVGAEGVRWVGSW
jgi:hypothetical protein